MCLPPALTPRPDELAPSRSNPTSRLRRKLRTLNSSNLKLIFLLLVRRRIYMAGESTDRPTGFDFHNGKHLSGMHWGVEGRSRSSHQGEALSSFARLRQGEACRRGPGIVVLAMFVCFIVVCLICLCCFFKFVKPEHTHTILVILFMLFLQFC